MPDSAKSHGGGAAVQGGVNFQNRVAAWAMVRALAGFDARPLLSSPPTALNFEIPHATDDLLLTGGENSLSRAFIQAKRGLNFSALEDSELASVFQQFVAQYAAAVLSDASRDPSATPPHSLETLVLATDPSSSSRVREGLRAVLARCSEISGDPLEANVARNADEVEIFKNVKRHIDREWRRLGAAEISASDRASILRSVRVAVLAVEPEGADESNALDLLRLAVLSDPEKAHAAWSFLVQLAADRSAARSGITIAAVREELPPAGFKLRATWDYAADIERLRTIARRTVVGLRDYSDLRIHGRSFRVSRLAAAEIRARAEKESLLVVGIPGVGKSGALHEFLSGVISAGADVICLSAEDLSAQSIYALRHELGLAHDLQDVLENWPGTTPGYLVVDSLDVLRTGAGADVLTKLFASIRSGPTRWRIVASIRKYDLRYSQKLQQTFATGRHDPAITTLIDGEFSAVAHVSVQGFTDEEINILKTQSESLEILFRTASPELYELLRTPFHVRLAAELMDAGVPAAELSPIQTRLELLDRYWKVRVLGSGGDLREAILKRMAEQILKGKSSRIPRSSVYETSFGRALEEILGRGVLVERLLLSGAATHQQLSFSHNVLADYAIARLCFPSDPGQFADVIVADPDLLLFARPALITFFELLWANQRDQFWRLALDFASRQTVPAIGRIIPGLVLAETLSSVPEFSTLIDNLKQHGEEEQTAVRLFGYFVRAVLADSTIWRDQKRLTAACHLVDQALSQSIALLAFPAMSLLHSLTDRHITLAAEDAAALGRTARRLLDYAWQQEIRDEWLVGLAIVDVCRTFASAPANSAAILRRSLEPSHLSEHGHAEIYRLAAEIAPIFGIDPEFAAEVYRAAFSYEEVSEDEVPLGGRTNQILPLRSTRKQDYEHAQWQLIQHFPEFVRRAPLYAARVVVAVVATYCQKKHHYDHRAEPKKFTCRGRECAIADDYSYIWDQEWRMARDEETQLLDHFFAHLEELAAPEGQSGTLYALLDELASGTRPAVIWRRLLRLGTKYPSTAGMYLADLASSVPLLMAADTQPVISPFVKLVHATAQRSIKEKVERAILDLETTGGVEGTEIARRAKTNIVREMDSVQIVVTELQEFARTLAKPGDAETHVAPEVEFAGGAFIPDDLQPGRTAASDNSPLSQSIDAAQKRLSGFYAKYGNSAPPRTEVEDILPVLRTAWELLNRAESMNVDGRLLSNLADTIALVGVSVAAVLETTCTNDIGKLLKDIFNGLSAWSEDIEDTDENGAAEKQKTKPWPSNFCRGEAAAGLITLAFDSSCCTPDQIDRIRDLANGPATEVRFRIAGRLFLLRQTAPASMWEIIETRVIAETENNILAALADSLARLAQVEDSSRCTKLLGDLLQKVQEEDEGDSRVARQILINALISAYLWRGDQSAGQILDDIATNAGKAPKIAGLIPFLIRGALSYGGMNDREQAVVRRRAIALFTKITEIACREFELAMAARAEEADSRNGRVNQLVQLIHTLSQELYFASGLFGAQRSNFPRHISDQQARFYSEISHIVDKLAPIGLAAVAYSNMELLEGFVEVNPRTVFLQVGAVVRAGKRSGYQYEQLAADLSVRVVEKYLAEQKELLGSDPECRPVLREILDTFVEAGWAGAQQLCFRLHEIYE